MIEAFEVGIAPDHVPALIAALLLPIAVRALRRRVRGAGRTVTAWAAWLLGIAAVVHLALPVGHFDGVVLTLGFLGSGAAYAWLAVRAFEGRSWRLWSALLIAATLVAYTVVILSGREEPDQVGIATALVEVAALGLALIPAPREGRRRLARAAGASVTVLAALVVGALVWVASFVPHDPADHAAHDPHGHAALAQAGVIMRPVSAAAPTAAQRAAAEELAAATRRAMTRYARLDDAIAAGYALPKQHTGPDVHLENKAYRGDGRVLDPERPEMLVYAIQGGRATLLGVVFVMEQAGVAGAEPGGPITRWHAHNICLTLLPPGFGVVSPFGSCPALSVAVTTPEMMHVWIAPTPAGPFADAIDKKWALAYNARHGEAFSAR